MRSRLPDNLTQKHSDIKKDTQGVFFLKSFFKGLFYYFSALTSF